MKTSTCHGCNGKGWVSPSYGVAVICPVCKGKPPSNPIRGGNDESPSLGITVGSLWKQKEGEGFCCRVVYSNDQFVMYKREATDATFCLSIDYFLLRFKQWEYQSYES